VIRRKGDAEVSECLADSYVEVRFFQFCFCFGVQSVSDSEVFMFELFERDFDAVSC